MRWKRALQAALSRSTGYTLVRADAVARGRPGRRRRIPPHYDAEARDIIRTVQARTMTSSEKLFALIVATRHVADHGVDGAIVECGVWRGGSMHGGRADAARARRHASASCTCSTRSRACRRRREDDRRHDGSQHADDPAEATAEEPRDDLGVRAASTTSGRRWPTRLPRSSGSTSSRARSRRPSRARRPSRSPCCGSTPTGTSRRGTSSSTSTRGSSPGGVLIIDDYGHWQGAARAVDEYFAAPDERAAACADGLRQDRGQAVRQARCGRLKYHRQGGRRHMMREDHNPADVLPALARQCGR